MSKSTTGTIQLLAIASILAFGLALPNQATAQTGYECILDTDDGGTSQTTNDTDSGADANGQNTNLACGASATAGSAGENTALGGGATAGGDAADENTAVGEFAMAGIGTNSDDNTAIGEDTQAGAGNGSSGSTAVGEAAEAGVGVDSDDNVSVGEFARSGVGSGSAQNTAIGDGSSAGLGDDSDLNTALGASSSAGGGNDSHQNTTVGSLSSAGMGGGDYNSVMGTGAQAGFFGGDYNTVMGAAAEASPMGGDGSATAIGGEASANFDRSTALGAGATATRANQMVYGTDTETHTMPGITSDASRAEQSGPLELVTTDAAGNLASDRGDTDRHIRRNSRAIDDNSEGIAMALSLQDPDLTGDERLGLKLGWGTFSGENAMGVTVAGVVMPDIGAGIRLGLAGGAAFGLDRGNVGGRAGVQLSW